ncbi:MAG: protein TolQ [Porticoccaceae bacterium]|nr:protein TolQ [Porticoccaceae bacterium]
MEETLSIWSLIVDASLVVQAIMAILVMLSVMSWVVIIQRGLSLSRATKEAEQFEENFWSGLDLRQVYADGAERLADGKPLLGLEATFRAGFKEFNRLRKKEGYSHQMITEGIQRSMRISISHEMSSLERHLPFLASVASVSPYIGLFGTVWGIMNSFRGLAAVHQATLATVAPGISEALVATAMGLFAAIPAVLAYNRYAAKVDSLLNTYSTFAEEFAAVLSHSVPSK